MNEKQHKGDGSDKIVDSHSEQHARETRLHLQERVETAASYDYDPQHNSAMRDDGKADDGEKTFKLGKHEIAASDLIKLGGLVACFAIFAGVFVAIWPYVSEIFEEGGTERLIEHMQQAGPLGVGILLALQLLQVIVAFIPGEVVQIVAGMLYGPVGGSLVILVGATIASAIIFELVHALGAPFIRAMVSDDFLDKFRAFERTGRLNAIVFILFLIPGLPKDVFTYLVGLTDMRLSTFLLLSILGRTPGVFVSCYAASSIMEGDYTTSAILFAALALIALVVIAFRDKLMEKLSKRDDASHEA